MPKCQKFIKCQMPLSNACLSSSLTDIQSFEKQSRRDTLTDINISHGQQAHIAPFLFHRRHMTASSNLVDIFMLFFYSSIRVTKCILIGYNMKHKLLTFILQGKDLEVFETKLLMCTVHIPVCKFTNEKKENEVNKPKTNKQIKHNKQVHLPSLFNVALQ